MVVALSASALSSPQSKGPAGGQADLDRVLRQLETTGKTFQNFWARFAQKKYTAVLREFDAPELGVFVYARAKDGSALLRQEVQKPAPRVLTIKGGLATIYQPQLKQAQLVNLGNNKDKAEYLALGLGQSPGKLRQTFVLKYLGAETIAGSPCSMLNLKPKNASAAAFFSSITLWVSDKGGIPIQQKLEEPNGDYLLVSFSDAKLNTKVAGSLFEQKFAPGTDVQTMR
jgi:outer membrane lipoprotein-sorting protein